MPFPSPHCLRGETQYVQRRKESSDGKRKWSFRHCWDRETVRERSKGCDTSVLASLTLQILGEAEEDLQKHPIIWVSPRIEGLAPCLPESSAGGPRPLGGNWSGTGHYRGWRTDGWGCLPLREGPAPLSPCSYVTWGDGSPCLFCSRRDTKL